MTQINLTIELIEERLGESQNKTDSMNWFVKIFKRREYEKEREYQVKMKMLKMQVEVTPKMREMFLRSCEENSLIHKRMIGAW